MKHSIYVLKTIGFLALFLFNVLTAVEPVWANPTLNPCENITTDTLDSLRVLIRNFKKYQSYNMRSLDPSNANAGTDYAVMLALQKENSIYSSPKLYTVRELFDLFKMQRVMETEDQGLWRGELAGVLFTGDNVMVANLEQHFSPEKEINEKPRTSVDKISLRLSAADALSAANIVELARTAHAMRIKITPDLTFHFEFSKLEDGTRFVNYVKDWLKRRRFQLKPIPLALDLGSGLYAAAPSMSADVISLIERAYSLCDKHDEETILKYVLDQSPYDFLLGLPKNVNVDEVRRLFKQKWPPFAPSQAYIEKLGDLSTVPKKVQERILHMAATMEGLAAFEPSKVKLHNLIPQSEPEQTLVKGMIQLISDTKEFGVFLADLMRETALLMQSENTTYTKRQLSKGILPREYVYKVLKQWNQQAGLAPFQEQSKLLGNSEFRQSLKNGLPIDKGVSNLKTFHGIDVHIVQMMFLYRRMAATYGPDSAKRLLDYMTSSDDNITLWSFALDYSVRYANNNFSPEIITMLYAPYLDLH